MNENPSFLVYMHLGRFLENRGLRPVPSSDLKIGREKFTTELNHTGYYRLDAEDSDHNVTVVIILATQGKYTDHGPQLGILISSLNTEAFARENRFTETIVIAPETVMEKKNMTDVIRKFRAAVVARAAGKQSAQEALATYYNMYAYHILSVDVPRVRCVPVHEIISAKEVEQFLSRDHLALSDLKKISAINPPVVWIGARPGQVVRIIMPSETAGHAYDYRLVTN